MKKILIGFVLVFLSAFSSAETTKKSKIARVLYNGNADFTWFIAESGWHVKDSEGNTLCNPYYVQIRSSVLGRDKLLSVGLAAKMSGAVVDFIGQCSSDPSYFDAHYIRVY